MRKALCTGLLLAAGVAAAAEELDRAQLIMYQKTTMEDMTIAAGAAEAYAMDYGAYPTATNPNDACIAISPIYCKECSRKDRWGRDFIYYSDGKTYIWISAGSDGKLDHPFAEYVAAVIEKAGESKILGRTAFFENDIVLSNGRFLKFPDGKQSRQWGKDKATATHPLPSASDVAALRARRGGVVSEPKEPEHKRGLGMEQAGGKNEDLALPFASITGPRKGDPAPDGFKWISSNLMIGGQPDKSQLMALKEMGFTVIINMQDPKEDGVVQERMAAEELGLTYVSLPVNPETLDWPLLEKFQKTLRGRNGRKTLIHCASGNRSAGLWALHRSTEISGLDAIREATYLGLQDNSAMGRRVRVMLAVPESME